MKTALLFVVLLAISCAGAHAQAWVNPLPLDSATHKVSYSAVVQVPGASKIELYSRAREWYASTFGSSKAVLEMDDKEAGKLIGKAYAQFEFAGAIGKPLDWALWRTIKVEVKDGKYRYTITDFLLGGPIATPGENPHPIEAWMAPTLAKGKQPGKMVLSVIDGTQATGQSEAVSLQAAMTKPAGKDW